jgi:hypothetical protein
MFCDFRLLDEMKMVHSGETLLIWAEFEFDVARVYYFFDFSEIWYGALLIIRTHINIDLWIQGTILFHKDINNSTKTKKNQRNTFNIFKLSLQFRESVKYGKLNNYLSYCK